MKPDDLKTMLDSVKQGTLAVDDALQQLRHFPSQDIGCAQVDHHRHLRQGTPEMIFGEGKTAAQIVAITAVMSEKGSNILVTRLDSDKAAQVMALFPG
ncbi:MAG: 1-(5-phosphoribosyl)-5-amino-4-imidazole-carboxylate carboxylase, partial [Desulfuromonadaceae bacterium]|nr:1-(5-phosphoribosyl)-5-amino-4-imidazole-carboxylate carboxylase [Desulfuromonadaceae bacterium]